MTDRPRLASVDGLARIPGPPPTRPTPPAPTPATEPAAHQRSDRSESSADAAEPSTRSTSAPKVPKAPKASETATIWRDISFTTPTALRDALRTSARADPDKTRAAIVLEAIEATHHKLTRLVEGEKSSSGGGGVAGLFPDPVQADRRSSETRVAETLRVTEANVLVLDRLVLEHKAENRSQLLTAALRHHLAVPPEAGTLTS